MSIIHTLILLNILNHFNLATPYGSGVMDNIGSGIGLLSRSTKRYLKQCSLNVNWTSRNKPLQNLIHDTNIFIQENAFENAFCKMAAISC